MPASVYCLRFPCLRVRRLPCCSCATKHSTPAHAAAYNLYLLAGPARLYVAVADVERNKFLALEEYQLGPGGVPALAATHDFLLLRGWNAVRMAITGRGLHATAPASVPPPATRPLPCACITKPPRSKLFATPATPAWSW